MHWLDKIKLKMINFVNILGVDLNRNFDIKFGFGFGFGENTIKDPCGNNYCGPKPFSESESKSVSDFIIKHKNTLKIYITFHAYSQTWLYPYVN